jgi:hypothetical protein
MNKPTYKKILNHPDSSEIISKLIIDIDPSDISEWLRSKYCNANEQGFWISEKVLKAFKDNHLDFYQEIMNDVNKTKTSLDTNSIDDIDLAVKNNPSYEDAITRLAKGELDVEQMMGKMALAVETRIAQVYDLIQEDPRNINTRVEKLWIELVQSAGDILDKYYRWKTTQTTTFVQNNVSIQIMDQHISVFHDVIKDVLAQMDLETSLYFMEVFNDKMAKLKMPEVNAGPTTEMKLAEAKVLNEKINQKVNS